MPKRKRWRRPASAAPQPSTDWAKFGAAWGDIAHSALGSPILAGLVAGAVTCLGVLVENELSAKAEAAGRARNAAPAVDADPSQSAAAHAVEDATDDGTDSRANVDTEEVPPAPPPPPSPPIVPKAEEAASALGIGVDATADEIRAALRARLSESRLHPDHGGDGEEAKRLIAAKNLLIERTKNASA